MIGSLASSTADRQLASSGGRPIRVTPWATWPRADAGTEQLLKKVLYSGRWAISGPYRGERCFERQFSTEFAAFNGVEYCVPTTSGTASLTLALSALGVGPGDEVLVPGLTWVACASSVVSVGATPILVDIDPATLAMSPSAAGAAITTRTRAILLVHPFCRLGDIDAFLTLGRARGVPVIEDCSQAHGARWRGRRVGTFGAIGCFSMQQSKVLTSGEGGAAITDDPELYDRMEQLRSDGRRFGGTPRAGHLELVEAGTVLGQNLCMSEFQAAILVDRLPHLDRENAVRAARADRLIAALAGVPGVRPLPAQPGAEQTYYNLALELDLRAFGGADIDTVCHALRAELDAPIHPIYSPMNRHRLYCPLRSPRARGAEAALDPSRFSLPAAEAARARCLSIPHYLLLDSDEGVDQIALALGKVHRCSSELPRARAEVSVDAF